MIQQLNTLLSKSFKILRYIFSDKPEILKTIDESYEVVLLNELRVIPSTYENNVKKVIDIVNIVLHAVNFKYINDNIKTIDISFNTQCNVYTSILSIIKRIRNLSASERRFMITLINKLQPILDCISIIINDPKYYISRLCTTDETIDGINSLF